MATNSLPVAAKVQTLPFDWYFVNSLLVVLQPKYTVAVAIAIINTILSSVSAKNAGPTLISVSILNLMTGTSNLYFYSGPTWVLAYAMAYAI